MHYPTKNTLTVLARAYYGIPLRGTERGNEMTGKTHSIKTCRRNGWLEGENKVTDQGLWLLTKYCNDPKIKWRSEV